MRPVRVLYVIDSLGSGGAQRQLVTLVRAVDRCEVEAEVAYYHPLHHFRPDLEEIGVVLHDLGPGSGKNLKVTARLSELLEAKRFDIVHSFLRTPGVLTRLAALGTPETRVVVSERNVDLGRSMVRLALERLLVRRADAVIANAEAIREELVSLIPGLRKKVYVVPNGIEWTPPTEEERQSARAFRAAHVGEEELLVAALGRVEMQKAPDVLARALGLLRREALERIRVIWIGSQIDEGLARVTEATVEAAGVADRFAFLGPTRDTRSVYLGADAVVLPSRWEGFPNVVLESLAHATPVVATDVGDTALLVREPGTGWIVPPNDAPALAEALEALVACPEEGRRAMGARGAEHVLGRYSAARLAERTVCVYDQVLGRAGRPGEEVV